MAKHFSLDIETLGVELGAIIVSVGIEQFEPNGGASPLITPLSAHFRLDIFEQLVAGCHIEQGAVDFHRKHKDAATFTASLQKFNANQVLSMLKRVLGEPDAETRIWCKGTHFDIAKLEYYIAKVAGVPVSSVWHYRSPRDTWPVFDLLGVDPAGYEIPNKLPHVAIYDAAQQADEISAAFRAVRNMQALSRARFSAPGQELAKQAAAEAAKVPSGIPGIPDFTPPPMPAIQADETTEDLSPIPLASDYETGSTSLRVGKAASKEV